MEQECIPVGCMLPTAVAVSGGGCLHQCPQDQAPHQDQVPLRPGTPWDQAPPLWTEFLTHTCENSTFPQTLFAGGKN